MKEYNLEIITPDGPFFSGSVESLVLRSSLGDVCILANHANYLTAIEYGNVKIKTANGERFASVMGGFLSVTDGKAKIIATTAEFAEDIDVVRAEKAKQRAEEILNNKKNENEIKLAEMKLKRALNRLSVSKKV